VLQAICFFLCHSSILIFPLLVDCCRVKIGLALESSDQKTRGFMIKIILTW
jgi:hypothetical protein